MPITSTRCLMAIALLLFPSLAAADVPVRVVRFDDIKPPGATLSGTFGAIGLDPQEQVYATLCNSNQANGDCYLFRWNPQTDQRQYLGSLVQSARRAGNIGPNPDWPDKEVIVKGHTPNVYLRGRMWMGTMGAHDLKNLSQLRGIHLFSYNIAADTLVDHSQWQPKGIFKEHDGIFALDAYPEKNLVVGIGPANCMIITYNPRTRETRKIPGLPKEDTPQLSGRGMTIVNGKVIYQCGSAKTPISIYDLNTAQRKVLDFPGNAVLTLGYVPTRDKSKVYISDQKTIYEFNTATERFRTVATFDPAGVARQVSPPALSWDEQKLYYVINQSGVDGGAYIDDLYEYNLVTNTRTKLMNLKAKMDGGAKVSGTKATASTGKIYFAFNANRVGVLEVDLSNR